MEIEILQPIVGLGDSVAGCRREFSLEVGMVAEVEDGQARAWISSGIARAVTRPPELETATLATPETATRKRPPARTRRKGRS